MNKLPLISLYMLMSLPVFGQLNLKAGYCLALLDAPNHEAIIQQHNSTMGDAYANPLKPLEILHGLDLGLEYRWHGFALEAGWRTKRNRIEGSGARAQQSFNNHLNFSIASFYGGVVQYYGPIRVSATFDYNYTRTKIDFEDPAILSTLKDHGWGSNFSLGYVLGGSGPTSLVIAPFVQIQWMDYDLTDFQNVLTDAPDPPAHEDYFNYGITIFLLNGPN